MFDELPLKTDIRLHVPRRKRPMLLSLAILGRVSMSPLTMSVPILGALSAGMQLDIIQIIELALLGLSAHIFGFALNDLIDHPLDKTSPIRQNHPLTMGDLSPRMAWLFTLIQLPLSFALYLALGGRLTGLGVLCGAIGLSVIYNLWSKWGRIPRFISEVALALSTGLLGLSAGLLNSKPETTTLLYALTLTLILLSVNSISSGLKDLKTDSQYGARSFVLASGGQMLDADSYHLSPAFLRYSFVMQIAIAGGFIALIIVLRPPILLGVFVLVMVIYGILHLRMILVIRSFKALRRSKPLLNGYYQYAGLVLLFTPQMPPLVAGIMLLLALSLFLVPLQLGLQTYRRRYDRELS